MQIKITSFFVYFLCVSIILGNFLLWYNLSTNFVINDDINTVKDKEIIVKFKDDVKINIFKILYGEDINKIIANYKNNSNIECVEENYSYKASFIPSDVYYNNQWYLKKIKASEAWENVNESPNVVIAIIDSGIQITHYDLKDNIWQNVDEIPKNGIDDDKNGFIDDFNGWDFINNTPDPSPKFDPGFTESGVSHGTIVAGIAAAAGNNNSGIAGITWKAKIMPLRVLNDGGEGQTSEVVRAVDYAIKNKADIINFSFVGFDYSQALYEAIKRAYDAGIIIVAAAGNEQDEGHGYNLDNIPMYPACHDGLNGENMVIGVAATDTIDQKADFSSYGFKCVDISAPGISIYSTTVYDPSKQYNGKVFNKYYDGYWSGTSMATPIVSGAAALLEGANTKMNRAQIVNALLESADNISRLNPEYLGQLGNGRLNLENAVNKVLQELNSQVFKIILAPGAEYVSHIKITDDNGEINSEFNSYDPNFRGGVNVASGDVDGDGIDEIITGAGFTGGPHVRIFDLNGKVKGQFFAYDPNFKGGVNVAVADIDGGVARKKQEIITTAGKGGGPHVRIFDLNGKVKGQFFAYDPNFKGGVSVSACDIDNDGLSEIITGAGPGGTPHVRIFELNGKIINSFYAYGKEFSGGVHVGIIKLNNN